MSGRSVPTSRRVAALKGLLLAVLTCPLASFAPLPPNTTVSVQAGAALAAVDSQSLKDGDLIFRRGRDLMASTVLAADAEARYSHVGLIVREGERVWIVHAVPDQDGNDGGVIRESMAQFLDPQEVSNFAIYRHQTLTEDQERIVRQAAIGAIGTPFDYGLRLSDPGELYCSELVIRAFAAARADFPAGLRRVQTVLMTEPAVTPDGLRESPALAEVMPST